MREQKKYAELQAEHQALQQNYTTLQSDYGKAQFKAQTIDALLQEARQTMPSSSRNMPNCRLRSTRVYRRIPRAM